MEQSETSLFELFEKYLLRADLAESSVELYSRAVKWFVVLFGDVPAGRLSYEHAEDFKSWLGKGRAKTSANSYLRGIKPFFSWMHRRRYIETNPFDQVRLFRTGDKKIEVYEVDEVQRMFDVADLRWQVIISLALNSMRRAEILNLVISDIDFEKNMILVSEKKDTKHTWRWRIKNRNQFYIGLPEIVTKLLIRLRDELPIGQPYICLKHNYYRRNMRLKSESRLTHEKRNNPWGNFDRDFKSLLRRAIVRHRRFHDLRATFATERYNSGYNLKKLQYLLRHSSIQTTARYIKNIDEQKLVAESAKTFEKHYVSNVP